MSAKTVRYALGLLQDDPEHHEAWGELFRASGLVEEGQPNTLPPQEQSEVLRLAESARHAHERRHEPEAAYRLMRIESSLRVDVASALQELLRFAEFELLDDDELVRLSEVILRRDPQHEEANAARARAAERRANWVQNAMSLAAQAEQESEAELGAAMWTRAAELAYRYARPGHGEAAQVQAIGEWLQRALALQPQHPTALRLWVRWLRAAREHERLAHALGVLAEHAPRAERPHWLLQRARLLQKALSRRDEAITAYEGVLDLSPGNAEATSALVDAYTAAEQWDHLVALYEEQLATGQLDGEQRLGLHLQVAMIRWRMQGRLASAAQAFDKVRELQPAHPGMLGFFREYTRERGERARLQEILRAAHQALPEGDARAQLAVELQGLAAYNEDAQKQIEQLRAALRADPSDLAARQALRKQYRQSGAMNALVELLRGELELLGEGEREARAEVLREIADVYRSHTKSDSALIAVLSQLHQLLPQDKEVLREQVQVYERLGRHRDVLLSQDRLAQVEEDPAARAEIHRVVARKWLQLSNLQNAIETFEKVYELQPGDLESRERLRELYNKRRAYQPLAELLQKELQSQPLDGPERRVLTLELAKLQAERLDQGPAALQLYQRLLSEQPGDWEALEAWQRTAERQKDYASLAQVLALQAEADASERGLQALQQLAAVCMDKLGDVEGAKRALLAVLQRQPGQTKALRQLRDLLLNAGDYDALEAAYEQQGDLDALVEVLSNAAERSADRELKIALSMRVARVCEQKLGAPERAFRAYERVLSVQPQHAGAARALIPLYEADGRHAKAVPLYEALLASAETVEEKVSICHKLRETAEQRLRDPEAALRYARQAFALSPSPEQLFELEQLALRTGGYDALAEALDARLAEASLEANERMSLQKRKAELLRSRGQIDEACEAYKQLLELNAEDDDVLARYDALLREHGRRDGLRALYNWRVERANTALKVRLLEEWAQLEEQGFQSKKGAAEVYQKLLEVVPQHGTALRALPRLLDELGDSDGALRALEADRDARQGRERALRELEIAKVQLERLGAPQLALEAVERALEIEPDLGEALPLLSQLLGSPETSAAVAGRLESHYEASGDYEQLAHVLQVLLASRSARAERVALLGKLADCHERRGDAAAAFDTAAQALREQPAEAALWDTFERLARLSQRMSEAAELLATTLDEAQLPDALRGELLQKAASWFEDELGDLERALPYLQALHARQPHDPLVFERLKQALTSRERWQELSALIDAQIALSEEASTRLTLLEDGALIAEQMRGDAALAVQYYERILQEDPQHESASRSLESLHRAAGRHVELAQVLQARLQHLGDDPHELRMELARLSLGPLDDPRRAMGYLTQILEDEPLMHDARVMLEGLLVRAELRQEVARQLERVHDAREDARALVAMLEIQLEQPDSPAHEEELLRRVAQLRDERLSDDAGALEVYAKLLARAPDDDLVLGRLLVIGRRLGKLDLLVNALLSALSEGNAQTQRAQLALELGQLQRERGDLPAAAWAFEQVRALEEVDADALGDALRALDALYQQLGDAQGLRLTLEGALEHDAFAPEHASIARRLGELLRVQLNDPAGAMRAYERALQEDEHDATALSALTELYDAASLSDKLLDNLRAREPLAESEAERRELAMQIARVLGDRLERPDEAIDQLRMVHAEHGPSGEVFERLIALYTQAERWEELAALHEERAQFVSDDVQRVQALLASGHVLLQKLQDAHESLQRYRAALSLEPNDALARAAVLELTAHPEAGREAAEVLEPLYEAAGEDALRLRMVRVQIERTDDVDGKLERFERALAVAEAHVPDEAFSIAAEAMRVAMDEPAFPLWQDRMERLARSETQLRELAESYAQVASETLDEERKFETLLRLAGVRAGALGDEAAARATFAQALEIYPEDERALAPLTGLLERCGDHQALAPLLLRRADASTDEELQKGLLAQRARLLADELGDVAAAIVDFTRVLELGFDRRIAAELGGLYAQQGQLAELVELYELELGQDDVSAQRRTELQMLLGDVLRGLGEQERALDAYEAVLAREPQHQAAREAIEVVLPLPELSSRAAAALEPVYRQQRDWHKLGQALDARVLASDDPQERIELLRVLARLREEQQEDFAQALSAYHRVFAEDVRDRAVWSEQERLARVAGAELSLAQRWADALLLEEHDDEDLAELARRTGALFARHGQSEAAVTWLERHWRFEPSARGETFAQLDVLYTQLQRHEERLVLHNARLELLDEPSEKIAALYQVAQLLEGALARPEQAIDVYREVLELAPSERQAHDALLRLLEAQQRWPELAEQLMFAAEQSAELDRQGDLRLKLAALHAEQLAEPEQAIDEYAWVLQQFGLDPHGALAVQQLHAMLPTEPTEDEALRERSLRIVDVLSPPFEKLRLWPQVLALLDVRELLARDAQEQVQVLSVRAELLAEQVGDKDAALQTLRKAFLLDPGSFAVRERFEALSLQLAQFEQQAQAYVEAAAKLSDDDALLRRDLRLAEARVHDQLRREPRAALAAYAALLDELDDEPELLDKIEELSALLSEYPVWVRVLLKKADNALSDEDRARLLRQVGELRRDMLGDRCGAAEAYEQALAAEPDHAHCVECLIELLRELDQPERLAELLDLRVEQLAAARAESNDVEQQQELAAAQIALLSEAARLAEGALDDRRRALSLWQVASELAPYDGALLCEVGRLLEVEQMDAELLDNLVARRQLERDPEAARALWRRETALRQAQGDLEGAMQGLRGLLLAQFEPQLLATVMQIAEENPAFRAELWQWLAELLRPAAQHHEELAQVLRWRFEAELDAAPKLEAALAAAAVYERDLQRPDDAWQVLLATLSDAPGSAQLLDELVRLAQLRGGDAALTLADAVARENDNQFDAVVGKQLSLREAALAEHALQDLPRAARALRRSLEQGGEDDAILRELARLHAALGEIDELAEVLERRAELLAEQPALAADVHAELAQLFCERDPGRALAAARAAQERAAGHTASLAVLTQLLEHAPLFDDVFETLEGIYTERHEQDALIALHERRIARAEQLEDRIAARLALAEVVGSDPHRAQRVLEQALREDPSDEQVLAALDAVVAKTADVRGQLDALARALRESDRLPLEQRAERLAQVGERLLREIGDAEAGERALAAAVELTPENRSLHTALIELRAAPERAPDRLQALRMRARLPASAEEQQADYRAAFALLSGAEDANMADPDAAEELLREALRAHENWLFAIDRLALLKHGSREGAELLLRHAALSSGLEQAEHELRAAEAFEMLGDRQRARELYEQLLQGELAAMVRPRLRALYQGQSAHAELSQLLLDWITIEQDLALAIELRCERAKLLAEQLNQGNEAASLLQRARQLAPDNAQVREQLLALLEKLGRDDELIALWLEEATVAHAAHDVALELSLRAQAAVRLLSARQSPQRALEALAPTLALLEADSSQPQAEAIWSQVADIAEQSEGWMEAEVALGRLIERREGEARAALAQRLAKVREALGDGDGAIAALQIAAAAVPGDAALREALVSKLSAAERWQELAALLQRQAESLQQQASAELPWNDAELPRKGAVAEMFALYTQAAELHVQKRNAPADAAQVLEQASAQAPNVRAILLQLCDAYVACGRERDAASVLERIIASFGGKRSKELAIYHQRLAIALAGLGEAQRALAEYEQAFKIDPGNIAVLRGLGVLALELGDLERAQKTFKALLIQRLDASAGLTKAEVFEYLGKSADKQGDGPRARDMYTRALDNDASLEHAKLRLAALK